MRIEFGKIINSEETKSKSILWYKENIKTLEEDIFKSHQTMFSIIYDSQYEAVSK